VPDGSKACSRRINKMTTTTETLNLIRLRSDRENAAAADQVYLNLKPDFQREFEAWNEKLCTRLIESVLLGRAMNPIWVVSNAEEECEEVLDGMHRLTTLIKFVNNEISIGPSLSILSKEIYRGKSFNDLSLDDKSKVRNYNFFVNRLDSSFRADPDKLQDMWEILNHSSKPLNTHEMKRPVYMTLYDTLSDFNPRFIDSTLYLKKESKRGELEGEIMKWIALSQPTLPTFNSLPDIREKWLISCFGENKLDVDRNFATKKEEILKTVEKILKFNTLISEALEASQDSLNRTNRVPYQMLVCRTVALVADDALLRRHLPSLVPKFKEVLADDFGKDKEKGRRNAQYQRYVTEYIDAIIRSINGERAEARLFSKAMINRKLEEQGRICTLCSKPIGEKEKYDGDHIKPWTVGGKTVAENLQVVHRRCHKKKEAILAEKLASVVDGAGTSAISHA
jgi:hypothetical protein